MGVIETITGLVGLARKVDNIELYRQLVDLQTQVYSLVEENRRLTERLAVRDQLTFKQNAYWKGNDGPYCSRCWDAEGVLVRLHVTRDYYPQCPKCHQQAVDDRAPFDAGHALTDPDND